MICKYINIRKKPLRRGLLIMNPSQSTVECQWALVANKEEKIRGLEVLEKNKQECGAGSRRGRFCLTNIFF